MIVQENVRMIVTVCRLKEGGMTKCEKYWPDDEATFDIGLKVKKTSEENVTPHLVMRTFALTDEFTSRNEMKVVQLHYLGWPDYGAPTGDTLNSFRIMLEEYIQFSVSSQNADFRSVGLASKANPTDPPAKRFRSNPPPRLTRSSARLMSKFSGSLCSNPSRLKSKR